MPPPPLHARASACPRSRHPAFRPNHPSAPSASKLQRSSRMPRRPYDARHAPTPGAPSTPAPPSCPSPLPHPLPSSISTRARPHHLPICLCSTSLTASDLTASPHSPNGIFASDPPIDVDAPWRTSYGRRRTVRVWNVLRSATLSPAT
jgi:hypothetical protein